MNALPGKHRTVIDCAGRTAAGTGIFYANNIFTANRNGYQLADSDVAVIVVLRHQATTYAYNDAMWGKYGAVLGKMVSIVDPQTKQAPAINPLNSREYGALTTSNGVTAAALAARGAHFAICDMATNRIAGVIASAVGSTQPEIYKELVANLLPNGHMVPAGVVAINRAQEFGYSMLTAAV
jgi:intracellular sulfur oxidation DsrE/DsrF family protein